MNGGSKYRSIAVLRDILEDTPTPNVISSSFSSSSSNSTTSLLSSHEKSFSTGFRFPNVVTEDISSTAILDRVSQCKTEIQSLTNSVGELKLASASSEEILSKRLTSLENRLDNVYDYIVKIDSLLDSRLPNVPFSQFNEKVDELKGFVLNVDDKVQSLTSFVKEGISLHDSFDSNHSNTIPPLPLTHNTESAKFSKPFTSRAKRSSPEEPKKRKRKQTNTNWIYTFASDDEKSETEFVSVQKRPKNEPNDTNTDLFDDFFSLHEE